MNFQEFSHYIKERIKMRYIISDQDLVNEMLEIASENIKNKYVIRFCRNVDSKEHSYFKTLLVVEIQSINLKYALEWAALCKDMLLDPETSDIYLFVVWTGKIKPSIDECLRIESSEDFCRKYVLRADENIEAFVERTFISAIEIHISVDLGQDPLNLAFTGLQETFAWFDEQEKKKWLEAFNSGKSSYDLFNTLIENKSNENEAS